MRTRLVADRHIGVFEIEVVEPAHAETLHQPPASLVPLSCDGNDALARKIPPRPCERRFGRFARITLSPRVLAQSPADFDLAFDRGRIADLQSAKPKDRAVASPL